MADINYDNFRKFFSYLNENEIITLEEFSDLLTEYIKNGYVTFNNLSELKSKEAKKLFQEYATGKLKI
jgi:hypothetical protein